MGNREYYRNRILLILGIAFALTAFSFAGSWLNVPQHNHFNASVIRERSPIVNILSVALITWIVTVVCTLITGVVRADAGVCCAAIGLTALSWRGGAIRYTLFGASPSVFTALTVELVLLFAIFLIATQIARYMSRMGLTAPDEDFIPDDTPFDQRILATAMQACATATLLLILCRTDAKKQCLASVGIASLLGSLLAGTVVPTRPAIWYSIGPMVVGVIGYVWAYFSPQDLPLGRPAGFFQALARPLPLDYASVGIAGSMLGYWMTRSWHRQRSDDEPSDEAVPADPAASQSV